MSVDTEDAPEPSSILAFWAKVAQGHSVPQGMDHAGLLLVMMGRQWADFGKASMQKLIGPIFRQVSQIQSKKELGVYRRRKKEPESLYFSWCAGFCFPKVRTIRSMLAVNATREFGEVGTC